MVDYPKVKIIRNEKREGLIKSRMIGVEKATANIITFLDSHCEMTPGFE
jgi:polypeptide N-acetylgalactosaminyltransferase